MRYRQSCVLLLGLLLLACGGGGGGGSSTTPLPPQTTGAATVLAFNDLGMHCMDREFSVFSILPPFNVVHSQVVLRDATGRPFLADDLTVDVFYNAATDSAGSINTYSVGKTDFWQHASDLFGIIPPLPGGEGLTGLYMPADDPQNRGAQPMEHSNAQDWFSAEGVPITPVDDALNDNAYPLLRIAALDKGGNQIGHLDVVVPVATETDCQACHATGTIAAQGPGPGSGWADLPDKEVESKLNILKLHDDEQGTSLESSQPVLCAQCHYSPALDLTGAGEPNPPIAPKFSVVMHEYHGNFTVFQNAITVETNCYQCHPGNITQCQRGAMATGNMDCFDCHGDMLAVGGVNPLLPGGSIDGTNDGGMRQPWQDLPRCQACHTGDAVSYLTDANLVADANWAFRLRQAYRSGDASASPLLATNTRFAENANTLFRFSKGHGGIACESCHGSTHAIWPNANAAANDNLAAVKLQGFAGTIIACETCHTAGSLPRTTSGPHGLHNVADARWYDDGHENFYENNKVGCKACHGIDLTGTPLAKTATARSFRVEDQTISYNKGDLVRCDDCHGMPDL